MYLCGSGLSHMCRKILVSAFFCVKPLCCFFVKLLTLEKKNPPIPPLSSSHQVRKTSEHSPLLPSFAYCPHSSPEIQYLTNDKQLTHLFFWGTRWLAPTLAELTAWEPAETETKRDNLVVKPQTPIKLLYFTIRNTDSWLTKIPTQYVVFWNNSNLWHAPAGSSMPVNNPCHLEMHEKPLVQQRMNEVKVNILLETVLFFLLTWISQLRIDTPGVRLRAWSLTNIDLKQNRKILKLPTPILGSMHNYLLIFKWKTFSVTDYCGQAY